jgi:molybdopterin molybdotransferase
VLSYDDALAAILSSVRPLDTERVALSDLAGRVLAEPVRSPIDLPSFDNSSVDGYAVRVPVSGPLTVVGELAAGDDPRNVQVHPGQAVRIFTGGAIPDGANAVVMQEDTVRTGDSVEVTAPVAVGSYVRRTGDELKVGDELACAGRTVDPAVLCLIASAGIPAACVRRKPRVSVVETGAELVDAGARASTGAVYAANGLALSAAAERLGAVVRMYRSGDDPVEMESVLREAAADADLIVTSGGVSVGDRDLVRPTMAQIGIREVFWRVAIRPGRPVFFGKADSGPLALGLPGNPASSLVTFLLFARPAILAMQGLVAHPNPRFPLGTDSEPDGGVEVFLRARIQDGILVPVERQGSNMASSVARADALARLPIGVRTLKAGTLVETVPLAWDLPPGDRPGG